MDFAFTKEEEAFRQECQEFVKNEISDEEKKACLEESGLMDTFTEGEESIIRSIAKKLAKKGWLTMWWPKEYGGQGASNMKRLIFYEEMGYHRLPHISVDMGVGGINWVSPLIMLFGTEEQKKEHLPKIAAGERIWCSGYSEPNAGSDLSSLQTRAVADGDYYIVNGQKTWTSAAHFADWCWLAVRTDPTAKRNKGISVLLVDMSTPGIEVNPVLSIHEHHSFNEVFFNNTRVPKKNLLGEENQGWHYVITALALERSVNFIHFVGSIRRTIDELVKYANQTRRGNQLLAHDPAVRSKLADMAIQHEVARQLAYRASCLQEKGLIPHYEAAKVKLYVSELIQKLANTAMEVLGLYSQLKPGSPWAHLNGLVEYTYLMSFAATLGGGTSEIARDIIATAGLGLPRH